MLANAAWRWFREAVLSLFLDWRVWVVVAGFVVIIGAGALAP